MYCHPLKVVKKSILIVICVFSASFAKDTTDHFVVIEGKKGISVRRIYEIFVKFI